MKQEMQKTEPKVRLLKVVLTFCLSAAIVMGTLPCEPFLLRTNAEPKKVFLGTDFLSVNTANADAPTVYFGKHDGKDLAWRVINYDTKTGGALSDVEEGKGNITLLAEDILAETAFSVDEISHNYGTSLLKETLDGIYDEGYFTEKEKSVIRKRDLKRGNYDVNNPEETDCIAGGALEGYNAPYLWPLSAKETGKIFADLRKIDKDWWLRSPGNDYIVAMDVSENGVIRTNDPVTGEVTNSKGVRPALNIDLSSVFFSKLLDGNVWQPNPKYKLTLKDESLSVNAVAVKRYKDLTEKIEYSGVTGNPTQLSVLILSFPLEEYGWSIYSDLIYYGKLDIDGEIGSEGSGICKNRFDNTDHVYLLAEQVHDDENATDYCSMPVEITAPQKYSQDLKFDKPSVGLETGESFESKLTGAETSVSYKSSDEKIATVDSNGKVTAVGKGEATITASAEENTLFYSEKASFKVKVHGTQTIAFEKDSVTLKKGETFESKLTGAETSVSYKSSDEKVATVDSKGKVTAVGKGEAIITATAEETEYCSPAVATFKVTVEEKKEDPKEQEKKMDEITVSSNKLIISGNEITVDTVVASEKDESGKGYSIGKVEIPDDVAIALFNNLSEEEKERVSKGARFVITISVKESSINMDDEEVKSNKKKADDKIKEITGSTVEAKGMMLDMGLFVQVGNDEKKETEPAEGSGKIAFTVKVPVDMENPDDSITRTFYFIHIHDDGKVEVVSSGTGTEIPAVTDSFSYWYLTYVDEKKVDDKKDDDKKDDDKKEDDKKEDDSGSTVTPPAEKVITAADNLPMAYSEEVKGDFKIGYCHEIPFFGKVKPDLKLFGNISVTTGGKTYKASKIKVNKKKGLIQITGLENADKDTVKAVKKATKGSNGLFFKVNPYYVKDTDTVTPKFKKDGSLKSVKIKIGDKDYKAKKGEFSYDVNSKTIVFDGDNLKGSRKLS